MGKSTKKKPICGIYKITNKINGKCYIGQSTDIEKRWKTHKSNWIQKTERRKLLYRAFRKYGIENFTFEILQKCKKEILDEREEYWIAKYDSFKNGYNMNRGGHSHRGSSYHSYRRYYRFLQQENKWLNPELTPHIARTFQTMKHALLPNPDDEEDSLEYMDDKFIEELDGYDTMFFDLTDGYDNFEQWAECNLI